MPRPLLVMWQRLPTCPLHPVRGLNAAQAHPGLTAASFPWPSGPAYKMRALQFPYTAGALIYARDKDSGEVYLGADGLPRIKYWPSAGDQASMMKVGQILFMVNLMCLSCPGAISRQCHAA